MNEKKSPLYLIDGSGFLYRAYYGVRPLYTTKGVPVGAVYSFCRMIKKLIEKFGLAHVAVVWDSPGKTTRQDIYPEYKATRQAPPSDLFAQKEHIVKFLDAIGVKQIAVAGVEADDIMYTLTHDYQKLAIPVVLVTSDKDMAQLISEQVMIYDPAKELFIDLAHIEQKMGFPIAKLPFYYALVGDSSDNIPGVKGIGKVGATSLVNQFDSLDDLYAHIDRVAKESMRAALLANKENAYLSYQLFLLQHHPLVTKFEEFAFQADNWSRARELFAQLEFGSLLKDIDSKAGMETEKVSLTAATPIKLHTIQTQEQLDALCHAIRVAGVVAIDTEGTALDVQESEMVGICLACAVGDGYYIPFGHKTDEQQLDRQAVLQTLKPIFTDPAIKKVMHHAKYDQAILNKYGVAIDHLSFDTLIAANLVTKDNEKIGLKRLSQMYLGQPMLNFADVVTDKKYKNFSYVPLALATEYAAADAHQTLQLYPILQKELEEHNMHELYYSIELPLVGILLAMEQEGVLCDARVLAALDKKVSEDLTRIQQEIVEFLGPEFWAINLNSPKQLEQLLFEHLKLPPQKKSTKRSGYSTDVEVLEELGKIHPIPTMILKYRELFKLKSTYIDGLAKCIDPTGRIHTHFSQIQVATGRLASSDPNLQNIPVDSSYDIHIRSAFVPQESDVFLSVDYSQIELRVLAYLSQDKTLIKAFLSNKDIHGQTAASIFSVPESEVTSFQRQVGKRINFSILYGVTAYGLAKDLAISYKEAKEYIEKYFAQYPGVSAWMEKTIEQTKKHGYVTTHFGRRRYIPGIYEKNKVLYDLACRTAINTVAQGTAAEIMKLGMINLNKAFAQAGVEAKLLLQIHDELLISVGKDQAELAQRIALEVLEHVVNWNVPLSVTARFGSNWYEVTK